MIVRSIKKSDVRDQEIIICKSEKKCKWSLNMSFGSKISLLINFRLYLKCAC